MPGAGAGVGASSSLSADEKHREEEEDERPDFVKSQMAMGGEKVCRLWVFFFLLVSLFLF